MVVWRGRIHVPVQRAVRRVGRVVASAASSTPEPNIRLLYAEIVFASILSAAASFNAAYILRLGGSNALIGLLSSLPALIAICTYLPSARILERRPGRMSWIVGSLFLARLGYLIAPVLPLVTGGRVAELTVAALVAMQVPAVFFSTAWSPLLSDIVPQRARANVLSWRSILSSATIAPLIFLAGRWLELAPFPGNYQWLYLVGFVGGGVSTYLVSRIRAEDVARPTLVDRTRREKGTWFGALRASARRDASFARLVANTLLYSLGAWMVSPLFIIYYVRQLGATDGWIGTLGTLAHVGVIAGYWVWRRVIRRTGDARVLLISAPLVCLHPLLVALVPSLSAILLVELAANVIASGVNLSHSMIFLELLPPGRKYSATAIYSMIMNVGAFAGPLAGVALAEQLGIPTTLLIGAAMRLAGAALFYLLPVTRRAAGEEPPPQRVGAGPPAP